MRRPTAGGTAFRFGLAALLVGVSAGGAVDRGWVDTLEHEQEELHRLTLIDDRPAAQPVTPAAAPLTRPATRPTAGTRPATNRAGPSTRTSGEWRPEHRSR